MERSILTTCLVGCLTLGFLSLFSVYLPNRLAQSKGSLPVTTMSLSASSSLSEIVDQLPQPATPQITPPQEGGGPLAMIEPDDVEQSAGEAIDSMERDDFYDQAMVVAGAKTHRPKKTSAHRVQKKTKIKIASPDVAKHYPLKIYEPLEETPTRHYGYGFTVPRALKPAFEFWRNIYANYEFHKTILHDNRYLDIVYGVLDFSNLDENLTLGSDEKRSIRQGIEERKKAELKQMLLRFDKGEMPKTAGEHIVYGLFEKVPGPHPFKDAAERVRGQWGQKDRFMAGLIRSGRYMPMMEEIFIRAGVPKEMTRLVFVESMFQLGALSKVAAAGPWQFMPGTARNYMTMNEFVDERRDPLIAAEAAARLLLKNYSLVGSWPLAINGYNTGILRMVKAYERLRTRDIATIIQHFEDPGYQFASRNFYPEFLAALEVADHYKNYFGNLELDEPVPFDEIILSYNTPLHKLAEATGTDVNVLKDLNPAYNQRCFLPHATVPKGYTVRLPHRQKMVFLAAMDQIQAEERSAKWHVVGKGESLKQIAIRYQIPLALLKETNGMVGNQVKKGQILKIPSPPSEIVLETR